METLIGQTYIEWCCDACRKPVEDGKGWVHWVAPRWVVHHADCDPDPIGDEYWWAVERCRTPGQLLDWVAHLLGKTWCDRGAVARLIRRSKVWESN